MQPRSDRQSRCAPRSSPWLLVCALLLACVAGAQDELPALPDDIERLLGAEPLPPISMDPKRRYLLLVHEQQLVPIERLAEPVVDLAGRQINPRTAAIHAPIEYYGLTLVDLATGLQTPIALPRGALVGYPSWAPNGSRFAFTLTRSTGVELWIGEPTEARAWPLADDLSATSGRPCQWISDSVHLLCTRLARSLDADDLLEDVARQMSFGQPVVLSPGDARGLLEARLELVDSVSAQRRPIGPPAAFDSVEAAPAGVFLLVSRIVEPYPRVSGVDSVRRVVEVWDRFGRVVAELPAEARAIRWHAAKPATLSWIERRADRDLVVLSSPPYTGPPAVAFELPGRFSGLRWLGESDAALVSSYDQTRRRTELWRVGLGANNAERRLLMDYPSGSPRSPLMAPNNFGATAILVHDGGFYLRGERLVGGRRQPFLDHVSLRTGATRRLWKAGVGGYETLIDVLRDDARIVLTRREASDSPPNYHVTTAEGAELGALTRHEHPVPTLASAQRLRLNYARDDGLRLGASLYLPPDHDGSRLPLIVWAYPRQVPAASAAVTRNTQARYPSFERAFRLFFLLHGYAVLDEVSMPIVGSDQNANDTFIEQIVANAAAVLEAAERTGQVDARRVGVAGHSYGAFMVANLLAHSTLFKAGAALSGAYNRTLTPFGFQTERRTLWEARDTYLAMSPLLYSHRIEAPLLLVHGLKDNNAGTLPLQSTQFYEAIRGNGGDVELLLLPWEGHSYRARESVLKTANEMLAWFDKNLKEPASILTAENKTGALLRPSEMRKP